MGKKDRGATTTDELGNTISVRELEERKEAEAARAAAKARREAKAAAAASDAIKANTNANAVADAGDAKGSDDAGGFGIVSLDDQLRVLMIKSAEGGKLTGKEKKQLAKAEKEGRLPSLMMNPEDDDDDASSSKRPPVLSLPESWARALDAVSLHVRGGGGDDADQTTGAVVDVTGLDVSVRGARLFEDAELRLMPGRKVRSIHWSPYDRVGVVNADP